MQYNHPIRSSSNKYLLGWFVLASVLAHWLFITFADNKTSSPVYVNLSTPLMVTIVSSRSLAKPLRQTSPPKEEPAAKTRPLPLFPAAKMDSAAINEASVQPKKTAALPEKSDVHKPEARVQPETIAETPAAETKAISVKNVPLNHLRQQLKQAIKARFTYPRIARRMGWEGLVGISLHIEDDGSLKQVHIARSSGHKILDENARKTIQSIGRIQIASNLSVQASDTEIEVLYKLTD